MKKVLLCIWGIVFIVCFTACSKETTQPTNEKKASTSQSSSSQESPAPASPASGCPQAPPPGCPQAPAPGCPHQPVNPMTGMRSGY